MMASAYFFAIAPLGPRGHQLLCQKIEWAELSFILWPNDCAFLGRIVYDSYMQQLPIDYHVGTLFAIVYLPNLVTTVDDQDLYTIVITTYIPPRQVGDGPWTPWYADYYHR